jgi:PhnB protein
MNPTTIQPYLFFGGRCEEAVAFYAAALGAQVDMMMRYSDSPDAPPPGMVPPGWQDKIMHTTFQVGGAVVMASDGCEAGSGFAGFSLALNVATPEQAERKFAALADGGQVMMPMGKTFWSPLFGMVTDRFGVGWMVGVTA